MNNNYTRAQLYPTTKHISELLYQAQDKLWLLYLLMTHPESEQFLAGEDKEKIQELYDKIEDGLEKADRASYLLSRYYEQS